MNCKVKLRLSGGAGHIRRSTFLFFMAMSAGMAGLATDLQAQCSPIVVDAASQSADLSIRTTDGSCTLDRSENGGYIKTNTTYKLHINASVTGSCQGRVYQFPQGCVNSTFYWRTIGTSWLYMDLTPWGSVVVNPSNTTTIQNYNTVGPTNTLSTGTSYATSTLGPHVYSSTTNANQTACNFTPTTFEQNHTVTVNALKCRPDFLNPTGNIPHLSPPPSPDKVQVYLPTTISGQSTSGLTTSLGAAIDDWNTRVGSSTGVRYEAVSTPCTSGPACITVEQAAIGSCGFAVWDPPNPSTGEHTGGLKLQLHSSWTTWNAQSAQRTFAHELGHFLGPDNYTDANCGSNDAIMQASFTCSATATPATALTANDYVPVVNTV